MYGHLALVAAHLDIFISLRDTFFSLNTELVDRGKFTMDTPSLPQGVSEHRYTLPRHTPWCLQASAFTPQGRLGVSFLP